MNHKILITGASGAGATTSGILLAEKLGIPQIELDDLFWLKTDPPFTHFRSSWEMQEIVEKEIYSLENYVLSGDPSQWKVGIEDHLNLVVFLWIPAEVRIKRIQEREEARRGDAIKKGGNMYEIHRNFIEWTKKYDEGGVTGRTKEKQEMWFSTLECPVLRIEGEKTVEEIVSLILSFLQENH